MGQWHLDRWNGYSPSTLRNDLTGYGGYHDIIEWDGTWVRVRNWTDEGIHTKGQNLSSLGVCFIGNNDKHYPSEAQKRTFREDYFPEVNKAYPHITSSDIYPHRNYANKSCHGSLLSDRYYSLIIDGQARITLKRLIQQVVQLQQRLLSLLTNERMRG